MNKTVQIFVGVVFLGILLSYALGDEPKEKKLNVVVSLTDLADITKAVGGDKVEVTSLADPMDDPHYVTPKPNLMVVAGKADLFVEIGLELELWSENVIDGSGNSKIRPGEPGHVYASKGIETLEKPDKITRAEGDLHPEGNPHIWTDPVNARKMAENVAEGLKKLSLDNKGYFDKKLEEFKKSIDERLFGKELVDLLGGDTLQKLLAGGKLVSFLEKKEYKGEKLITKLGGWLKKAEKIKGKKIIFYHKSWIYFANRFGLDIAGYVEEKPGIPPSASYRDKLIEKIKSEKIKVIEVTNFYDSKIPEYIAEKSGATLVILPGHVGGVKEAKDYFSYIDYLLDSIISAFGKE